MKKILEKKVLLKKSILSTEYQGAGGLHNIWFVIELVVILKSYPIVPTYPHFSSLPPQKNFARQSVKI